MKAPNAVVFKGKQFNGKTNLNSPRLLTTLSSGQKEALFSNTTISTARDVLPRPVETTHSHSPLASTCTFNRISSLGKDEIDSSLRTDTLSTHNPACHWFSYLVMKVQSCSTLFSSSTPISGSEVTSWPLWRQFKVVILSTKAAVQWKGSRSPLKTTWRWDGSSDNVWSSRGPSEQQGGKMWLPHINLRYFCCSLIIQPQQNVSTEAVTAFLEQIVCSWQKFMYPTELVTLQITDTYRNMWLLRNWTDPFWPFWFTHFKQKTEHSALIGMFCHNQSQANVLSKVVSQSIHTVTLARLTTAQLAFLQSTQGFPPQAPGICTQRFVPQSDWTAAKEARDPAHLAVTWQVVWVEVTVK